MIADNRKVMFPAGNAAKATLQLQGGERLGAYGVVRCVGIAPIDLCLGIAGSLGVRVSPDIDDDRRRTKAACHGETGYDQQASQRSVDPWQRRHNTLLQVRKNPA
ncbi:MAG: hypothetical protein WBL72_09830 [Thermoguttaceae bacterium]